MKGDESDPLHATELYALVHCPWALFAPEETVELIIPSGELPPKMVRLTVPKAPKKRRIGPKGPKRRKKRR